VSIQTSEVTGRSCTTRSFHRGPIQYDRRVDDRGSASAFRALHEEEAARAASFGRTLAILCAVGLGFIAFLSRVRWLTALMACSR